MKRLILLAFILSGSALAFAQTADTASKLGTTRVVDGTLMSSSRAIIENISASPEFSTWVNAIRTAGLTDIFKNDGDQLTLFAPTNQAFQSFDPRQLDTLLLPAHQAELANLVRCHVIAGKISSKDIERQIKANNGRASYTTLSGDVLTAQINKNRNIVLTDENGGQSMISRFDILQSNGILHIVTAVLTPKSKRM